MSSRAKRRKRWEETIVFACGAASIEANSDGSPTFTMKAYNGGKLNLGNYAHPVIVATSGVKVHGGASQIPILRDHDGKRPVGHGEAVINADSLEVQGKISQTTQDAADVINAAKNGYPWQASIGGQITKAPRFVKAGKSVTVNGRQHTGPVYVVAGFTWNETSVVSIGADSERATTSIAAKAASMSDFDKWLMAKGFEPDALTDDQEASLKAMFDSETPGDPAAEELANIKAANNVAETRAELARVSQEIRKVDQLAKRYSGRVREDVLEPLHAQALEGQITITQFELELVKAARPTSVAPAVGSGTAANADAIVAAMCQTAGMSEESTARSLKAEIGSQASEKAMNDAVSLRNFNLHKLIHATLHSHGKSVGIGGIDDSTLLAALECSPKSINAAANFSTLSLPGILSRVANKGMLASYQDSMGVALRISAQTSTTDFKQFDRYRLTEAGLFEEVPATGEIKSSTLTEEMHQNQVRQYARMFGVTRVMLINDDLDALMQIPSKLGRMAAHTLEQAVISKLVDASTGAANSNFFYSNSSAKNKPNYAAGAETALDIDSLGTAYKMFLDQVDSDGKPIMVEPSLLLVTNKNAVNAGKLFNDGSYRFTGTDIKETIDNQWRGRFSPLVSPYLGTLGTTPSEDQWYLLPAPSDTAVVNVAFLRGQTTPTIQQSEVDFHQLGVEMRGVFDFGVELWDRRLAVKMKGAA